MNNNSIAFPDEVVLNKIHYVRGQKIMLDADLAELYQIPTKRLNEQVNRNLSRFPEDFMFRLTEDEYDILRSHFATSKRGGRRYLPYAFTEHGVLMLSSILNSERAIQVNIMVMRVFTRIRQMLIDNTELRLEIEKIKKQLNNQDKNIELLFGYLDQLIDKRQNPRVGIGFKPDNF